MKILVIVFMLVSLSAVSQNRFEKEFAKADSIFSVLIQEKTDSLALNESIRLIETLDSDTVVMRASDVLLIYWKGYTDCIISHNKLGKFDFDQLKSQIRQQMQAISKQNTIKSSENEKLNF